MSEQNNNGLKIPSRVSPYLVMTLNGRGPATAYLDDYAKEFIQYASQQTMPVLELGAAYGFFTIAALRAGATVVANDIEPRHLQILFNETPVDCRSRLTLLPGEFPQDIHLARESLSGCYVARMLGYLEPINLQCGFKKIHTYLRPNAKFFIVASSPYKGLYKKVIPLYEQRVHENAQWPGYFTDLKKLLGERFPDKLHFFDEHILTRELELAGFFVEKVELFARKDLPTMALLDGREGIVAIARKL